jgi:hypothetical protein
MTATLLNPGRLSPDHQVSDLGQDASGSTQHIRCCKPKQLDTGRQKPILAAIVLDETDAMELAVVLEPQSLLAVEQIRASKEGASLVAKGDLNLRTRQPIEHEQHPQASFHRRLCSAFGELEHASSRTDTLFAFAGVNPVTQVHRVEQSRMERHVSEDDCLNQCQSPAEVEKCAYKRSGSEPTSDNHLATIEDRLDRIAWNDVKAVQPGRSLARERC